jgi:DNA polymerase-3 subunit gamma/tau
MDIIEIDAASNRGIDEIRDLRESAKFAPVMGRYKVYIIDEAHMLTIEAFNALLKTLEEPPGHVIFILATTEPHKIPATILSRCQRFDFRMLTRLEIINRLRKLAEADRFAIEDEALSLIAESADGAMRDAESILDQLLSFSGEEIGAVSSESGPVSDTVPISAAEVSKLLGLGAYQLLDKLVENILQSDSAGSLRTLSVLAEHGADLNQCLKKLVSYFRDLMVYKINPDLIDASETKLQQLANQSERASIDKLRKTARILAQTESDIKQLGYERLNFELALIEISRLKESSIPLDKVLGKLEDIESKLASGVENPASVVTESKQVYSETADIEEMQDEPDEYDESDPLRATWYKLLRNIKEKHLMPLHAFLKEALPVSISDDRLTIDFGRTFDWHRERVAEPENRKTVEAELSELIGKPMKLEIKEPDSSQNNEDTDQNTHTSQRDMCRDAMQDENVKLVLNIFDGRVVEVKRSASVDGGI